MTQYLQVFYEDDLTPRIDHKLELFPRISYQYFISPALEVVEDHTTDYVPMNENPPTDGKFVAGTLQKSFFASHVKPNLFKTTAEFGYGAYNPVKGEYYAYDQNYNEDYDPHQPRYAGHKPTSHFFEIGIRESNADMNEELAKRYMKFLKTM